MIKTAKILKNLPKFENNGWYFEITVKNTILHYVRGVGVIFEQSLKYILKNSWGYL